MLTWWLCVMQQEISSHDGCLWQSLEGSIWQHTCIGLLGNAGVDCLVMMLKLLLVVA
jgi:hypothetical protein